MMAGWLHWRKSVRITTMTSRQFNQDAGSAKKAAEKRPVIITDRGRPAHAQLRFEDYQKLLGTGPGLLDRTLTAGGDGHPSAAPDRLRLLSPGCAAHNAKCRPG